MGGRRSLMPRISGGKMRFQFLVVGDFDNERTDSQYNTLCFLLYYCFKLIFVFCLLKFFFFGSGSDQLLIMKLQILSQILSC